MSKAVMKPVNKKIAFLTFKIVEETIKRVFLKIQIEKLMPVKPDTLHYIKKALEGSSLQKIEKQSKQNSFAYEPSKAVKPSQMSFAKMLDDDSLMISIKNDKTSHKDKNSRTSIG